MRSRPLRVGAHEFAESLFVHRAGSEFKDGLRRRFLARREAIAIEFEKKYADNKTCTLIAIDEWVILHNTVITALSGVAPETASRAAHRFSANWTNRLPIRTRSIFVQATARLGPYFSADLAAWTLSSLAHNCN